jgi:hypothetical protein
MRTVASGPLPTLSAAPCGLHFTVQQDHFGRWIATEDNDRAGGVFSSRDAALRYCAAESGHAEGAVDLVETRMAG